MQCTRTANIWPFGRTEHPIYDVAQTVHKECLPRPLGVLKQVLLACFHSVVTRFAPPPKKDLKAYKMNGLF